MRRSTRWLSSPQPVRLSDTESWVYQGRPWAYGSTGSTGVMTEWHEFVTNQLSRRDRDNLKPKLVCIDLQPYATTQAPDRDDFLNIGGFSDAVFDVVASYMPNDGGRFVREVEAVEL